MVCINSLVRKQWTEHEKLSYPIIQLPLELTSGGRTNLLTNKNDVAWVRDCGVQLTSSMGFTISIRVYRVWVGGLYDLRPFLHTETVGMQWVGHLSLFFRFAVGIAFLYPRLTCRFHAGFFLSFLEGGACPLEMLWGVRGMPNFPFTDEQSFGAYLRLVCYRDCGDAKASGTSWTVSCLEMTPRC